MLRRIHDFAVFYFGFFSLLFRNVYLKKRNGIILAFAGLVKGAQLGYDTGASIMGMVGGVVGGILGGAMGFLGALVGSYN